MVYRGTVKGGVVQFEGGVAPADGTAVRVEPIEEPGVAQANGSDPLFRMDELAVDTGIPDLASNLDRYLYGVSTGPDQHRTLGPDDELDGGTVLPGFTLKVAELFERVNLGEANSN